MAVPCERVGEAEEVPALRAVEVAAVDQDGGAVDGAPVVGAGEDAAGGVHEVDVDIVLDRRAGCVVVVEGDGVDFACAGEFGAVYDHFGKGVVIEVVEGQVVAGAGGSRGIADAEVLCIVAEERGEGLAVAEEAGVACAADFAYPEGILDNGEESADGDVVSIRGNHSIGGTVGVGSVDDFVVAVGRSLPREESGGGVGSSHKVDRTRARGVVDMDVVDGHGFAEVWIAGLGVLVEPEEGDAADAVDGVEGGGVGVPVGVETCGSDSVEVVDVAPGRGDVAGGGDSRQGRVDEEYHHAVVGVAEGTADAGAEGDGETGVHRAEVDVAVDGSIDNFGV